MRRGGESTRKIKYADLLREGQLLKSFHKDSTLGKCYDYSFADIVCMEYFLAIVDVDATLQVSRVLLECKEHLELWVILDHLDNRVR